MLAKLRSLFSSQKGEPDTPVSVVPAGQRVYAIGDIHGRLDLFEQLLDLIAADDEQRPPAETWLVLLGDLVDRGADSCGVVERALQLMTTGKVRVLAGNHEEMLLGSLENPETLRHFLRHGGKETLFSYGLTFDEYSQSTLEALSERIHELIPARHIAFMRAMENQILFGDYLFVHAGIRPGVALEDQTIADMRWIRREFLDHDAAHSHVVVHGHSITDEPEIRGNRIGIDTGAFASGRLTALGLDGGERWFLTAMLAPQERDAGISDVKT